MMICGTMINIDIINVQKVSIHNKLLCKLTILVKTGWWIFKITKCFDIFFPLDDKKETEDDYQRVEP